MASRFPPNPGECVVKRAEYRLLMPARMRALALFAPLAFASIAHAQTLTGEPTSAEITATVESFIGRTTNFSLTDLANSSDGPITHAECDATIRISFNPVDITRDNLEFFTGPGCRDTNRGADNIVCDPLPE